ncbi:alpha/beta fold hydrolase [Gracilimonas sp.]|uniref:alpha/beta hydrolase n=1 Tax=Gracilimonas sp. TaxID=1974203 RepID=UPI002870D615|nr:alpha/beta hydrolase [Gracilimonas sp.]
MRPLIIILLSFFCCISVSAQTSISGDWEGAINIQGQQLKVIFDIEGEPQNYSGTLDIPQQGAMELNLTRVEQKSDSVFFTFFTGQGNGEFKGVLETDSLITGMYHQGMSSFPFEIKKQKSVVEPEEVLGEGRELIISTETVNIGGTLVTPENSEYSPLVIMISGSGAQDRNSNIFGFKVFAEIAEYLEQQGISSFRYDDRQIGESTGTFSEATLDMLAGDVNRIIEYLNNLEDEYFSEIILLGHSQGGVVAGKVADENPEVDQLILMASTGVSLKEILSFQVEQAYGEEIHSEEDVEKEISLREELMMAIRDDGDIEAAKQNYVDHYYSMIEALPASQKAGIADIDAFVNRQADQLAAVYGSPQTKSLLFYDPKDDLRELDIPVLVLFGGKDTQVTIEQNSAPIEKALTEADTEFEVEAFPEANHLFQKAESGQVAEYSMLEKEFVDGFLDSIAGWVSKNVDN